MRENENALSVQQGRNKFENNADAAVNTQQDEAGNQRSELNHVDTNGIIYLDIIPRFAL